MPCCPRHCMLSLGGPGGPASSPASAMGLPRASRPVGRPRHPRVTIGTDCSGIEAPVIALENLGVEVIHKFACDNQKAIQAVIKRNFAPESVYDDVSTRDNSSAPKDLDLYVAGFPCQPFSAQGKNEGTQDDRGRVVTYVIRFIQQCRPKAFLLENVKGLVSKRHRPTFLAIMRTEFLYCIVSSWGWGLSSDYHIISLLYFASLISSQDPAAHQCLQHPRQRYLPHGPRRSAPPPSALHCRHPEDTAGA